MTRILIPVFNAATALEACLQALATSISAETAVTLIDDASTDPRVATVINAFIGAHPNANLISQTRNGGFVATVNRGIAACDEDVVLLNSDTLPTSGFLAAIDHCAASDARIATITPFSNNAEICSFPLMCTNNPLPEDLDACAHAFAAESDGAVDLPTGVGFCMWIRRETIRRIGGFDEATFGRGYGEENDFCQRAAAHGWRNVLCPTAYVAHVGHASFAATGERPGGENLSRLSARYPRYNDEVADFIARDPLAAIRARVALRLS